MELLIALNEWWDSSSITKEKAKEYKRKCFNKIKNTFLNYRQILILNGLRRVGKTTIIYQLIEELLNRKTDAKKILYFSFDELISDPMQILEEYSRITKIEWKKEKIFIFFDEIQKLKGWTPKIKILYDNFPNLKICVSGSASLLIERDALKDFAGRYFAENITVLTLQEFAELFFGKTINNFELYSAELKRIFDEYIKKPFPELVEWSDQTKINQYIRELVVEKIVKSDIPESFKNANTHLLAALTEIFLKDAGMILELTSLSKELGIHKLTLSEHIAFLEFGNIIRTVKNFRPSIRAESRKLRKIYPVNIALSFCFYPDLSGGKIFESLVSSALNLNKYWREGGKEIDFLKIDEKILPIEIKESKTITRTDLKNLIYFMKKYNLEKGYLIYSGKEEAIKITDKEISLLPIHKILFNFSLDS